VGSGCAIAGSACLLLAACSTSPSKPTYRDAVSVTPETVPSTSTSPPPVAESVPTTVTEQSPWLRLRQRFTLSACDYNPAVTQWSRRFSVDPAGFSASLNSAMPFLLVVLAEIEKRDMPGEFAFLPYIESNYTALASSGDRAAGIWQLMPDTAREAGLRITRDYDGRLDIAASTSAALDLLERYAEEFGDWRVADMAFNAGEYGIKDLRGNNTDPPTTAEIAHLRVPSHTHEHLAKLLAVSCVVADPERFHVELPDPQPEDRLAFIDVPAAVDFALIARIAGIDVAQVRHLNPGYVRGRVPDNGPYRLLLPAARKDAVASTLAQLPQSQWREWHEIVLREDESPDVLASAYGMDTASLHAVNTHMDSNTLRAGTVLLVPGKSNGSVQTALAKVEEVVERSSTHVVHAGDTLWGIAQRARVRMEDLLSWNGLHRDATLHLGQRLHLQAPESAAVAGVTTGAP
jgi:membrane-bound lytic murein transglycosylase D